jgi:hypothetical protein
MWVTSMPFSGPILNFSFRRSVQPWNTTTLRTVWASQPIWRAWGGRLVRRHRGDAAARPAARATETATLIIDLPSLADAPRRPAIS